MPPSFTGLLLQYLRCRREIPRPLLTWILGWLDETQVGRYERMEEILSEDRLRELAAVIGYQPEDLDLLLFTDASIDRPLRPDPPSPVAFGKEERRQLARTAMAATWILVDWLCDGLARIRREEKTARAFRDADELLERLLPLPAAERRVVVAMLPEFRLWSLAVRLCRKSVDEAAHKAEDALELAELACWIAERLDEAPGFRLRLEGYCQAHLGNARRVADDFAGAEAAFATAKERWEKGTDAEPPLLPGWWLPSLEASLRRAQHRFGEALDLIDRARKECGEDEPAVARLLVKKANVLEQQGDHEAALAVLKEAAPLVENAREPRLLSVLRFNIADNLCRVGRHAEAAKLLPKIRKLAAGKELDEKRVLWLQGRIQSALGERLEALDVLEQVRRYFTGRKLAYDAALSGLDLALLWLEMGRATEVRELAARMGWIFKAKGIEREALAALRLFCEAAEREAATADLTRKVIADVERVRRMAPRRRRPARGRGKS